METLKAPSRSDLVRRASDLVPLLQKHAAWGEKNRRLHEEVLEALTGAGLLRMRIPARYGGYESDMRTVVEVISELAKGDGSASWVTAVFAISTWMAGLFPDEVQDEIFAVPDVRVTGILGPSAVAVPTAGGVTVNGKWTFNTGAQYSRWNTNAAVLATADGGHVPVMLAIPVADLEIIDDWHTSGLRATGSVSTAANGVFVPSERVLEVGPVLQGQHRSTLNAGSPIFRAPFMPTAVATVSAPALGLGQAATEAFLRRLPGRKITYTAYDSQSAAPITHLQVADARVRMDEAAFHAYRLADMIDAKANANEPWTLEERALARLDLSAVCQRAKEATDTLFSASGGSSVYTSVPIQRIARDIQTVSLHAIVHPANGFELYGRVALGLEPNTPFV